MKFTKRDVSSGEGSNKFLKFKDGENKQGVFRGEVYEFKIKWVNNKSQVVDDSDPEGKSRFRLNFVTAENGVMVAKIFEFGVTVYNLLADISEEYELAKTKVKITRHGTGTDTAYLILPILKEPLTAKQLAEIEKVPLNNLEVKQSNSNSIPMPSAEDEIPF